MLTCSLCGFQSDELEVMLWHLSEIHDWGANKPYVKVWDCQAYLAQMGEVEGEPYVYEELVAEPQPPDELLYDAIERVGGSITWSGRYPLTPELEKWIEENKDKIVWK